MTPKRTPEQRGEGAMTDDIKRRLQPSYLVDQPADIAVSVLRAEGGKGFFPVADRLSKAIVANNDLKRAAIAHIEALERERDAARYIPGEFRCAKCGFTLSQFKIRASDGAVGDRDEPGEKCPNDGSPLWRVTWEQRARDHFKSAALEMTRADDAEARAKLLATTLRQVKEWLPAHALPAVSNALAGEKE